MAGDDDLSDAFTALRPQLLRIAYGTLGSVAEAEDVVQDAWLRLSRLTDPGEIHDLRAWLTRVVGRLALDALRRARHRREQYVGQWLPEPVVTVADASRDGVDPADRVTLDESVTMALLIVLEQLTPAERTAFVLHDVFGMPFEEVAEVVDAFATACADGDLGALLTTLDESVIWRSDSGGRVASIRDPLLGRDRVAKALLGFVRRAPRAVAFPLVNGWPGIVLRDADGVLNVLSFTVDRGAITSITSIRNPDKLAHVRLL